MIILDLIHNVALLLALTVAYEQIHTRLKQNNPVYVLITGVLFGIVTLAGMMTPMVFAPGVIYDGRSIVLSAAGYIGGPFVAFIAASMAVLFRVYLGGAGVLAGVLTIIESALLGVVFFLLRNRNPVWKRPLNLWILGIAVHALMLLSQLALPGSLGMSVIGSIGIWIMLLYPVALVLILLVFINQQDLIRTKESLDTRETWYRSLFEDTFAPRLIVSPEDGQILDANTAAERFYGWSREELCTMRARDINTISEEEIRKEMRTAAENQRNYFKSRHRLKDGTLRDVAVFSSVVQLRDRKILNSVIIDITEQKEVETRLMHVLRQKDSLLQEVHHRVRNNLALVSSLLDFQLQDMSIPKEEYVALKITANRVQALSMIHNLLYQNDDLSLLNFTQFLRVLAETLPGSCGVGDFAGIRVDGSDILLDVHYAMPLGLMVNELLVNLLGDFGKVDKKAQLVLDFHRNTDNQYIITLLDEDGDFASAPLLYGQQNLSRELVAHLAGQINGKIDYLPEKGTLARICFAVTGESGLSRVEHGYREVIDED
jgi:PAS domain S-box-containing protein